MTTAADVLDYLLVAVVVATVTALSVPGVAWVARREGAVRYRAGEGPGDDGGTDPVPTFGGLAMYLGLLAGVAVAARTGSFGPLVADTSEPLAILVGATIIVVLGFFDDTRRLSATVKLAGQLVATTAVALLGVQLVTFWVPGFGVIALSPDLSLPVTVIALVGLINIVNLIDGLDGLASGIVAIGAATFLVLTLRGQTIDLASASPTVAGLLALIVAALALGFLVHNWYPARIFMGDTGSMLLGLLLGGAAVSYVGRTAAPSGADFYGTIPLIVPVLVLAVPFLDGVFAVVRRVRTGQPVTRGDEGHLHHVLLAFGHSHRRAAVVLYYWSALVAGLAVAPSFVAVPVVVVLGVGGVLIGAVLTALGARRPGR